MTAESLIKEPEAGARIVSGQPTPDNPIIPFIEGDGIGVDITPVMQSVVDAAVSKAYDGARQIHWMEVYAGEKSTRLYGPDVWSGGGVGKSGVAVAPGFAFAQDIPEGVKRVLATFQPSRTVTFGANATVVEGP